jgi:hypothetical protein
MRAIGNPMPRQAADCSHAVRMIQRPTPDAIALSAKVSMKAPGPSTPRCGCRQRSSASAPTTALSERRICGWK